MRGLRFLLVLICGAAAAYSQTQSPAIAAGGVLNGASFDKTGQPIAPGSLVSIFGTNLSAATLSADSIPLSTSLSGVTVTFNGISAPLEDVVHQPGSFDQINAQVPWELLSAIPSGAGATVNAQVVVTLNGMTSAPATASIGNAAPGIFTFPGGIGQAVAYGNVDGAIAAPSGAGLPFPSHPAKIGDPATLVILATGLGAVNNPVPTGGVPPAGVLSTTLITPTVLVGGVPAQVVFSGLSPYVGVYQLNIVIAAGTPTGDAVSLQIQMNGVTSRNDVTIAVSQQQ
ncbi:MAG TPA: hypothetical protein VE959_04885 [Bryobacteraceae bacterium]|nr:hypothetical protein [Bryobacteraceae bacterium]